MLDKGLSYMALASLLQTAGATIDIVKLGWGTSYVSDGVRAKVPAPPCRHPRVPGRTLLEICEAQGRAGSTSIGCAAFGSRTSR